MAFVRSGENQFLRIMSHSLPFAPFLSLTRANSPTSRDPWRTKVMWPLCSPASMRVKGDVVDLLIRILSPGQSTNQLRPLGLSRIQEKEWSVTYPISSALYRLMPCNSRSSPPASPTASQYLCAYCLQQRHLPGHLSSAARSLWNHDPDGVWWS